MKNPSTSITCELFRADEATDDRFLTEFRLPLYGYQERQIFLYWAYPEEFSC
jgi:hypothetical protein